MTYSLLMLIFAIHGVESTYWKDPDCRGNEYQITRLFVDECNRIAKLNHSPLRFTYADRCDRLRSQEMMMVYLSFYGEVYTRHFGHKPDVKFYALVYHLGWTGYLRYHARRENQVARLHEVPVIHQPQVSAQGWLHGRCEGGQG